MGIMGSIMADTATTTESRPEGRGSDLPSHHRARTARPSHSGPAVVAGLAGLVLLGLSAPSLLSGVLTLDARSVLWDVYAGETISADRLTAAAADLAAGLRWTPDGELQGDRSLVLLRAAEAAKTAAERRELLEQATASAMAALASAPGQPGLWARLAYLRLLQGEPAAAAAALRLSMLSGAFVPAMMASRIELGLRLLPALDPETVELLRRQIRLFWLVEPNRVAELSERPEAGDIVREALNGLTDADMLQFQRLHGKR